MDVRKRIAVVGVGNMGSRHARVIDENPRTELVQVHDLDAERAATVAAQYGARTMTNLAAIDADAVVVAVSTERHTDVVLPLLNRGIPLLIEKPVAAHFGEVQLVLGLAEALEVPVMCGFVERHNAVVQTVRNLLDGPILHLTATRHSPPAPQIHNSVVSDLLIHDIDLAVQLFGDQIEPDQDPGVAGAVAPGPRGSSWSEIADCTVTFPGGGIATFSSSRVSQRKVRTMSICTERSLYELDLLRQDITVYRHVSEGSGASADYRSETVIEIPFVRAVGEPLACQLDYFCDLIDGDVDLAAERWRMLLPHRIIHAVEGLTGLPVEAQRLYAGEMITWIDDEVATVIDASTVELANFGTVGLLQGSVEPVAVEATPAELLPTGTAVRFEIDLEVTRERHRASGLVFRKDDGRFVPGRA
jgi:predicted dehydrogenase